MNIARSVSSIGLDYFYQVAGKSGPTSFIELTDRVLDGFESSVTDLVPAYATAVSGEALKAITDSPGVTYQDLDAWSQAMIDGVANHRRP